jgi:hypothetical protein
LEPSMEINGNQYLEQENIIFPWFQCTNSSKKTWACSLESPSRDSFVPHSRTAEVVSHRSAKMVGWTGASSISTWWFFATPEKYVKVIWDHHPGMENNIPTRHGWDEMRWNLS